MSSPIKTIAFWMVILFSGVLMWQVVKAGGSGTREVEISFSRFLQDVDHGDVSNVTIIGTDIHGKYKSGGVGFHTIAANDPTMIKDLRDNGVNISVKDNSSNNNWPAYLLNLSPLILFAALWFVMIRQLQTKRMKIWHSATTPPPFSAVQGESFRQSPRLVLANSEGALAFGHCQSQNGQITFYPETQIGPVVAWMLAPSPPTELLGLTK